MNRLQVWCLLIVRKLIFLLICVVLLNPVLQVDSAFAANNCVCEQIESNGECVQGYCVDDLNRPLSANRNLVYYLHGGQGSLTTWSDQGYYTQQLRDYWSQNSTEPPVVVAVSYGPGQLLAEKNQSKLSGLFEDFEQRMRPTIEKSISAFAKRAVFGESMGAFSSVQVALRTDKYTKAASLCGVISETVHPFSTEAEILREIRRSSAFLYFGEPGVPTMLKRIQEAMGLARAFYPTQRDWEAADPLALAEISAAKTEFYIANGYHDEFASYEGNVLFAKKLKARGFVVDWRPQWGGHCAVDIPSLAEFLAN